MDIKKYIESGILEEYCLGMLGDEDQAYLIQMTMLYPEIKVELTAIELALEKLAAHTAVEPPDAVKNRILAKLGFKPGDVLDINELPPVNANSQLDSWLNALSHLITTEPEVEFGVHVIRQDAQYQQMLVITNSDVPEEEHGDLLESFFILDGRCECTVGTQTHLLGAGDFLEIPMNVKHDIRMLTPYVVGILQYQFV